MEDHNYSTETIEGFGQEWSHFTQRSMSNEERSEMFSRYFSLIDWNERPTKALDFGCGSGRWSLLVAPRVDNLVCADASPMALNVAKENVPHQNVQFVNCTQQNIPFPDEHFDFIFSLGVLHHIPDTEAAIRSLSAKLLHGGRLLLYLYYAFDNRPFWFRALWRVSDFLRKGISALPFPLRLGISQVIAVLIYWPLARLAKVLNAPDSWPLKGYADRSFYYMRTDALDRFGTKCENRFTRQQITVMLSSAGFDNIRFSDSIPHWICTARKL